MADLIVRGSLTPWKTPTEAADPDAPLHPAILALIDQMVEEVLDRLEEEEMVALTKEMEVSLGQKKKIKP